MATRTSKNAQRRLKRTKAELEDAKKKAKRTGLPLHFLQSKKKKHSSSKGKKK
jgi:uncharacterized protein (DUF111 family)